MKKIFIYLYTIIITINLQSNDDFVSLLDEVSDIATKNKVNIDYQPSVVSVFDAKKLKKLGVNNLHEAIGLIPGVETSILHTGWKQVIIRGNYNPDSFVFDKYKLYIDGTDVGSSLYSTSYYYLDFPIELIDKIEILRGSASSIYGPGAFSGAINVITKISKSNEATTFFATAGSYGYTKAGFIQQIKIGNWNIGLDGYHQYSNKKIQVDESFVDEKETAYTRSEYNSLEGFKDYSVGITTFSENTSIKGRYKHTKTDNFYGMLEFIEPVLGGYQINESGVLEIKNLTKLNKNISLETKTGLNYYLFSFDSTIYNNLSDSGIKVRFNPTYSQLDSYISLDLKGKAFKDHTWLIGSEYKKAKTLENSFGTTYRDENDGPTILSSTLEYLDGNYGFIKGDIDQSIKSIYIQDIYSVNKDMDISFNARIDEYSLFDKMLSYRVGSVYRLNDNNILKAVYGRSLRAPSYIEAYQAEQQGLKAGNPNLKPETIDTYELAYTYKKENTVLRTNIFYSILKDVIDFIDGEPSDFEGDYANHKKRKAGGFESELMYSFKNGAELMTNFSYVNTQYYTPHYTNPEKFRSPLISEYLLKAYLLYPISEHLSINSILYHSGPKNGMTFGSSTYDEIDSSTVINETLIYNIDGSSNVELNIKNIFNEDVIYPSFYGKHNGKINREERNWLLSYSKTF